MRTMLAIATALLAAGTLGAAPAMTPFDPATQGFRFANTFINDFVPTMNIRTGGLCGGMTYAALDWYNAHLPIPNQDYRPAKGSPLQTYLYSRQVHSIMANIDSWVDVLLNLADLGGDDRFRADFDGKPDGQLAELRSSVDRGVPVPLMLQGAKGRSGDHQVLAIGYDLGRYQGDLGANQADLVIFTCDPNNPGRKMRLAPDLDKRIWVKQEPDGAVVSGSGWQSWTVDRNYHAMTPPAIINPAYAADGRLHELIITCQTGDDDLRGGKDNLNLTVNLTDGTSTTYENINLGARWIPGYEEAACVLLREPIRPDRLRDLAVTLTAGGDDGGDTWDMLRVDVRGRGGDLDVKHLVATVAHRITPTDRQVVLPVTMAGPPAQPETSRR